MSSAGGRRAVKPLGCLVSAVLSRLCCPPFDVALLAFGAWTPLLIAVRGTSPRRAALLGWLQGSLTNLAAFSWTVSAMHDVARLSYATSVVLLVSLCALQGLRVAVLAGAWAFVNPKPAALRPLVFGALLALVEGLFPMAFPWGTYGFVHHEPVWAQTASFGGAILVTGLIGAINEGLACSLLARGTPRIAIAAAALAVIGLMTGYGAWRMKGVDERVEAAPKTRVLVVQAALRPANLETRDPAAVYREATLTSLSSVAVDWVAWPETAVSYGTHPASLRELFKNVLLRDRRRGPHASSVGVPLVTGLVVQERDAEGALQRYNSVVAANADGQLTGRYDKRQLVPLGEGAVFGSSEGTALFTEGNTREPVRIANHPIATVVCFEALHGATVRAAMAGGEAELLLNPTSDAWFDGTIGPRMHLAFVKIRAVEHGRYLLRPTTTGLTALVDPAGRMAWSLPEHEAAAGVAHFAWLRTLTPFTAHGQTPTLLASALICGVVLLFQMLRARRGAPGLPRR